MRKSRKYLLANFKAFRCSLSRSLFKGPVSSFGDVNSIKISLLYIVGNMNQICPFCEFLSWSPLNLEEDKDMNCWV